ncbi:hypothetical protein [Halioxenophilus aromaticivorans]|uniref:Uncharacterized protein n=1 Tax=Halioxenophilus aromaticivorans TaxID=1306992 RepID=A0AAV3U5Y4_9ALTE
MSTLFVLRNQDSLFINRQGEWVSGREANSLFRAKFKDEALNEVFEISARDFGQRITVEEVQATEKGQPIIPEEWVVNVPQVEVAGAEDALAENAQMQGEVRAEGTDESSTPLADGQAEQAKTEAAADDSEAEGDTKTLDFFQQESA